MDKQEIVNEIGRVQGELTQAEADLREWERKAEKARRDYTSGLVGLILGIVGLVIFWPLAFLGLAGLMAVIMNVANKTQARTKIEELTAQIADHKATLARMQAQLLV